MTTATIIACAAFGAAGFAGGLIFCALRAAHAERPLPGPRDREWPQRHVPQWPWPSSEFPASDRGAACSKAALINRESSGACAPDAGKPFLP